MCDVYMSQPYHTKDCNLRPVEHPGWGLGTSQSLPWVFKCRCWSCVQKLAIIALPSNVYSLQNVPFILLLQRLVKPFSLAQLYITNPFSFFNQCVVTPLLVQLCAVTLTPYSTLQTFTLSFQGVGFSSSYSPDLSILVLPCICVVLCLIFMLPGQMRPWIGAGCSTQALEKLKQEDWMFEDSLYGLDTWPSLKSYTHIKQLTY